MHVSIPGSGTRISSSPWPMACCFRKGEEYAHGGLSLQECLTLELTITQGTSSRWLRRHLPMSSGKGCVVP